MDQASKNYALEHKKEIRDYKKQYAIDHKEEIKEYLEHFTKGYKKEKTKLDREYYILNKDKINEANKLWRDGNKETIFLNKIKKYGLSLEEFNIMLEKQNGVCSICKDSNRNNKRLSIDHDHLCCPSGQSCGRCVRGLLCSKCNLVLGNAIDNPEILKSAIEYLESFK